MTITQTVKRKIVAFDGEGIADRFVLLADSEGNVIRDRARGLKADRAIGFLTRPELAGSVNVWFSFSYDLNMIFRDIRSVDFWTGARSIMHKGWKISLKPGKMITFFKPGTTIKHYDLFSFFQCSFVVACEKWIGQVDPMILKGKAQRKRFDAWTMRELELYNRCELRALVELSGKLVGLIESLEIPEAGGGKRRLVLGSFHGPGAVAQKILSICGVNKEIENQIQPVEVDELAARAYFGGRIELINRGPFRNIWHGDIRSAYPSAAIELPDLSRCVWRKSNYYEESAFGLWVVSWSQPIESVIGVLPYRQKNRSVVYPVTGAGVYWSDEVKAALDSGIDLKVHYGYVITRWHESALSCAIDELYQRRKDFRDSGGPGEDAVKVALNSIYGKLAQRPSGGSWNGDARSILLAGIITARVRAKMLSAAMDNQDGVIGFATDGLFCRDRREVNEGPDLGQWSVETIDRALFVQSGFYRFTRGKKIEQHTRGFMGAEIDWQSMTRDFDKFGSSEFKVNRFVNNLLSIMEPVAYPVGSRFVTVSKLIDPDTDYKRRWSNTWGKAQYWQSWPRSVPDNLLSQPFNPIPYRHTAGVEVIE